MVGVVPVAVSRADEGELLLREFAHRTGNEIAVAIGALSLAARDAGDGGSRTNAIDDAILRLRSFGDLNRLLAKPTPDHVDLGSELAELCRSMRGARSASDAVRLRLDVENAVVGGRIARRVLFVAAELASNAYRYAFEGGEGELSVTLRINPGRILLVVSDDGSGVGVSDRKGTGYGTGIVRDLLDGVGGAIVRATGRGGTTVSVEVPIDLETTDAG